MHSIPGAFDRTIVTNSLSKTYSITGWRIGYVQAAPAVIRGARKVHDYLTIGAAAGWPPVIGLRGPPTARRCEPSTES